MERAFLQRPAAEWERVFMALKIPGAGTKTTAEWIQSEHALSSGLVRERRWEPDGPTVREANRLVWLDRSGVPGGDELREAGRAAAR